MDNNWTIERTFSTYEEASELKHSLQHSTRGATLQVKIHRYAPKNGQEVFTVKTRTDPGLKDAIREVEQKVSKRNKKKDK